MGTFSEVASLEMRVFKGEGTEETLTVSNDAPDLGCLADDPTSRPPLELVQKPIRSKAVYFLVIQDLDSNVLGKTMDVLRQLSAFSLSFLSCTEILGVRDATTGEGCCTLGTQYHPRHHERS
jgi:hypothetical protein